MDNDTCRMDGCDLPVKIKKFKLCSAHYQRRVKYGTPEGGGPLRSTLPKICTVDGCSSVVIARGLCNGHYIRDRNYGDPLGKSVHVWSPPYKGEGPEFVADAVANRDRTGCWTDGCFAASQNGYPMLCGTPVGHRSMSYDGRPRPSLMIQLHSCDNPQCWNPNHLSWGTHQGNADDRESRGRGVRNTGENHGNARMTDDIARRILARYNATKHLPQRHPERPSLRGLAAEFGVTTGAVAPLINGRTWLHLQ